VVVTRGPDGADLLRPGRPVHRQPAFPVEVVDSTGAGDAFCAALAVAMAEGRELEDAVRLAAAAGALACRGVGARTSLPTREELDAMLAAGD
jgi:ribokinase